MAVLASDDFNRADENPLASPWATQTGLSNTKLLSNRCSYDIMDGSNRGNFYGGVAWPADQWSKAKLYCVSTGGVRQGPALYVRMAAGAITNYRFSTDHAAATNCNISRFVAGVRTTVVDFTQAWSDGDEWELWVEGPATAARLRTFLNGVQKSDTTDNSSIAAGFPGIGVSGNATITSWSIDDWSGGDFNATPSVAWWTA